MWSSFWRSRDRFSLDELRYLTDQLMKVQIVNEVNKDFVIEALRSIAELITYGDQHDAAFFEFFMEKQVLGEFVRILRISRTLFVSLQLLQTMSIIIQNLKSEHSIYYMFCNEHVNCLITYSFDFRNEELLSYYISFLRTISGKLNKDTISLLVKTCNDDVVSFPLYVEAIRFAFHEEGMIRTAVRALTLNVYHVGDEAVNKFVASNQNADYFLNLVKFFRDQCISFSVLVSNASKNLGAESTSSLLSAIDEIEDNLYYFSDVISAGIPEVGRLIMDGMLTLLIFPLILPSLRATVVNEIGLGAATSLYLLCCILRIVKIKDLASTVASALLCHIETFASRSELKLNGHKSDHGSQDASQIAEDNNISPDSYSESLKVTIPYPSSSQSPTADNNLPQHFTPREALLSFITCGDDVQVSGSLSLLATLLQTKELDESTVDALGILPQRKQHKKLLLQALVGEEAGEDQLFSSESTVVKDGISGELDIYLQKLKSQWKVESLLVDLDQQDQYGVSCTSPMIGASPRVHRFQVLDALVSLLCRSNVSAETLWDGGWLLRQLLPHSKAEFRNHHARLLKDSFHNCARRLLEETRGTWPDMIVTVLCDEWRKCKRVIEASSLRKDPMCMLLPPYKSASEELVSSESSFIAGERMCETVKVVLEQYFHFNVFPDDTKHGTFCGHDMLNLTMKLLRNNIIYHIQAFVLLHHLHIFSLGRILLDQPPLLSQVDIPEESRAKNAGVNPSGPKPGNEINLVNAVPCRIAFERGKERHFYFLSISMGSSGWVVLAEELVTKPHYGIIRVAAPLAGCNPRIDDKHPRWLHLRIRPSLFSFTDVGKHSSHEKVKSRALVDGRWTLAFRDLESCKVAFTMILEEIRLQSHEVERRLKPLLELEKDLDSSNPTQPVDDNSS